MRPSQTIEDEHRDASEAAASGQPVPGLILIFAGGRPAFGVIPLNGGAVEVGRGEVAGVLIDDKRMSRPHARITFDEGRWKVTDLGSRNGTAADGVELARSTSKEVLHLVRAGTSLFLLARDTRPWRAGIARTGDAVMGPALQRVFQAIGRAARFGRVLHITGESGSGKELSARAFHDAGPASSGPFVAVNAATLKPDLAEALLFGARKGAYTGAVADRIGYIQSAQSGTLFLDEVAELELSVQAKLLRALETREVLPLGATRPEQVEFGLCSATNADLRSLVTAGKMREDLYFRIGTPTVVLPPLRERPEEIPWLLERALQEVDTGRSAPALHVSFVEACLLRRWPGNVRELAAEARTAAQWAAEDGGVLLARHLHPQAGIAMLARPPAGEASASPSDAPERPSDAAIEEALRAEKYNVARAARALGMHRTQLYRWMTQRDFRPKKDGAPD